VIGVGHLRRLLDGLVAHSTMSKQALDSEKVREGFEALGPAQLYEALREKGAGLA
jgi:type I restriction enzyme R subunit